MEWLVQIRDAIVRAVDGQAELDQIVGADGEEVHFRRQQIGDERGGRDFDHRADLDPRGVGLTGTAPAEAGHDVGKNHPCLAHFFDGRDEREHDAQRPVRRGAHQRPHLRAQHLGVGEPEPQAAQAGPRAPPFRAAAGPGKLPLVEVERANGDRSWRDLFNQAAIERVLIVLGDAGDGPARQHEFRTVEADALGAMFVQERQIFEQLDVGFEANAHAVGGGDRARHGLRGSLPARLGGSTMRLVDLFGRRRDDQLPRRPVQYHWSSRGDSQRCVVQANDRRHLE